jgi:DNA primase
VGGNVFKFLELREGLNFPEALQALAARAGIALPTDRRSGADRKKSDDEKQTLLAAVSEAAAFFRRELDGPAGSAARAYLAKRGVSETTVRDFGLGFAPNEWEAALRHLRQKGFTPALLEKAGLVIKRTEGEGHYDRFRNRIIFPIRDPNGTVIGFGGRVMDDSLPKYLNSPETPLYSKSNVLYCLDAAKEAGRKQGYFIIVEGYLDALACHQSGFRNAVATLGTALTEGHLRLLRRFADKLVLIFDPDPAGVKATLRSFDLFAAGDMKVNVVSLPGGDDPDTYLHGSGAEAFASRLRESVKFMDFVLGQVVGDAANAPIDDKVRMAGEMLALIARLPSAIERDHYMKKTAEGLGIDEPLLRQELAQRGGAPARPTATARERRPAPARGAIMRPRAEEILLHLLLTDAESAAHLGREVSPADFTDPLFQRAAEMIFTALRDGRPLDAGGLFREGDDELNSLLARLAVLDAEYDDRDKTRRDCVDRIREQGLSRRMKSLSAAIRDAEARGNEAELRKLLEDQRRLVENRRTVRK